MRNENENKPFAVVTCHLTAAVVGNTLLRLK